MTTRRTTSRLAAFTALAVAFFGGAAADASTSSFGLGDSGLSIVIVIGGQAFTVSLTGVTHSGGAGSARVTGVTHSGGAGSARVTGVTHSGGAG